MTKYIPLEQLKTFLKSRRFNSETKEGWVLALSPTVIDELDSLQTIDPIATIDEIIEEPLHYEARNTLQELKSRLSLTQK